MRVVKALLTFLGYVYHGLLCLAILAMSALTLAAGAPTLQLGMLPWTGSTLLYVMLGGSLAGLLSLLLAIRGVMRPLFFVWSLVVTVLLVKGYIFSGYHFSPGGFRTAVYLIVGSIVALLGAWARMSGKPAAK